MFVFQGVKDTDAPTEVFKAARPLWPPFPRPMHSAVVILDISSFHGHVCNVHM